MTARPTWEGARGLSLVEIMLAITILSISLISVFNLVSTSGKQMQKSQNLGIAIGIAHKIAQHMLNLPSSKIVSRVETPIYGGAADDIFSPFENTGSSAGSAQRITAADLPKLHGFLQKYDFRYTVSVVGNSPFDVKITVTWQEGGQHLMYALPVYVAPR
jgi:Tfp pilus assembly protein PilV